MISLDNNPLNRHKGRTIDNTTLNINFISLFDSFASSFPLNAERRGTVTIIIAATTFLKMLYIFTAAL